ncbi:MAG: pyridoxine 5'-phosphate synthase [Verrucomicrobiota bacterium]
MDIKQIKIGVNIDHSATLRQARYREHPLDRGQMVEPDPVEVALLAQRAGADAITLHLREDRRHIQDSDVHRMREMIQVPMNLEMACTEEMLGIAEMVKPEVVLLVPEGRTEVTTEGGIDVAANRVTLGNAIRQLKGSGIAVSLFIDPCPQQIQASAQIGATYVELHTGAYAHAFYQGGAEVELERLHKAAEQAHQAKLLVNAGHGINYVNIHALRQLPHLYELNIGHSIISRAVLTGISEAVREMKALMNGQLR